jgi:RHS repeat-associated protein
MRRLGPALALLLLASVALANPGDARVSVTLKPDVVDVHAAGEEMVAMYGGRLIETSAQTVVLEISIARSGLVARDPRVASVTVLGSASSQPHAAAAPAPRPLAPRANGNDPCTTAPIGLPRCTGAYQYDGAGNIRAIGNDVFVYDAVGRLKSATLASAGGVAENYDYDAFGNLKKITASTPADPRPELTTDPLTNHLKAVTTAKYDEAGNLTSWSGHEYTYDAANMLTEMNDGVADMMYVYTADDERIATLTVSNSGYVATWRIRGLDDKVLREFREENYSASTQPWSWTRDYVYRGGLLLSSYMTSPIGTTKRLDYHLDHLGTPRLITDENGQQVSVHHYYPFGREITSAAGETMKFTGHERDFAPYDYQDYMHARYDNPYLGRFLSVDPSGTSGRPLAPQTWNRYAYARGNPLAFVDPNGRDVDVAPGLRAAYFWGQLRSPRLFLQYFRLNRNHNVHEHIRPAPAGVPPGTRAYSTAQYTVSNGKISGVEQTTYIPAGGNTTVAKAIGHELGHVEEALDTGYTLQQRFAMGDPTVHKNTVTSKYDSSYESDFALDTEAIVESEIRASQKSELKPRFDSVETAESWMTNQWMFSNAFGTEIQCTRGGAQCQSPP